MRLILNDCLGPRSNFHPLSLCRPTWELLCGMTTLGKKLAAAAGDSEVACFVPPYLAESYREQTAWPVNDPASLRDDDLVVAAGWVKAASLALVSSGPSRVALSADGEVLLARITRADLATLPADSLPSLLEAAKRSLPVATGGIVPAWNYIWELVAANDEQLAKDFRAAGRSGIEGVVQEPAAFRGSRDDLYVAPGATVHPMVVLDATAGPIYIDQDAEIHPFTRVEGPCYVGKQSILLGTKCRQGNTIGPLCRVGGEVEQSILQGYTNKYHDGFLGHAYVGQWVNLGAGTTNSDLRNDYGRVRVVLDGHTAIDTGSSKVGALIGDHTKTCIGTLLNTGACVGAMAQLVTPGVLLPKFITSFSWVVKGAVSEGPGRRRLYETARAAMARRGVAWTAADEALWEEVYLRMKDKG